MSKIERHTYEYNIDLNSDVAPARVLRMVKPGSKVLDVGAGPGSITRHLSGKLGCDVVALEIDPTALEKLKSFARQVHALDLNDPSWSETIARLHGSFDHVIAADVLEHVYDPWQVLGGMASLLSSTGSVILSLPHVGHAAVAACLIDEDFEYRSWGLLDRTHIRFFGIKNIQALYDSQNLAIETAEFVVRTPMMTEFAHRWRRLPADVQMALQRNRFAHVYQVVSRAVPASRATASVRLMDLSVPPPEAETVAYWEKTMERIQSVEGNDLTPTIIAAAEQHFAPAPQLYAPSPVPMHAGAAKAGPEDASGLSAGGSDVRLIAFYLTQFHPIPENDQWWGKGFTEWTNVTKATPLFRGHYQPHLPTDLGFYDLRVRETRLQQIALAKANGIDGFCYYYYWFSGKRLLERPLDDMLSDPASDMPFCLCWANENWTRRWDAAEDEILIAQRYRPEDDIEFIKSVEPFLRDPRYIHVEGAPLLVIYRPQHLPNVRKSLEVWREYCASVGLPRLHLACALTHGNWDHIQFGFDSGVEFPPHNMRATDLAPYLAFYSPFEGCCPDYTEVGDMYLANRYGPDRSVFRGVMASWDNTARCGPRGRVLLNGTPQNYEYWLAEAIRRTRSEFPGKERLVFINAWNEWAEGCHLEPDRRWGHAFLEATVSAKQGGRFSAWTHRGVPTECILPVNQLTTPIYFRAKRKRKKSVASRAFRVFRDAVTGRTLRRMLAERRWSEKQL